MKHLTYAILASRVILWTIAFRGACLVSREARQIRADLVRTGECIDPIRRDLGRLEVLHVELFGDEHAE